MGVIAYHYNFNSHFLVDKRGWASFCVCIGYLCIFIVKCIYKVFFPILILIIIDCYCYSVAKLYPILCDHIKCSTPGFPVPHYLPEFAQTHVHWVSDAIQSSHPLLPTPPLAHNGSQHHSLFQWVGYSHQVAKVLTVKVNYIF